MVGIVSSSNTPSVIDLTKVVLPAFCNPTIAIYNYLLKNFDFIQAKILSTKPNICFLIYFLMFKSLYIYYCKKNFCF